MEIIARKTFGEGETIFREGAKGDSAYIVEKGAVIISKEAGARKLIIDVFRAGEVFGEMAFIGANPRTATARALGETTLGVIHRDDLKKAMESLPSDMRKIIASLVRRLRKITDTAAGLSILRKEERQPMRWEVSFTHGDVASGAFTRDASPSGLFIATDHPLNQGDVFLLDLTLPSGEKLEKISCEVRWSREQTQDSAALPPGMGVRFIILSPQDKKSLQNALNSCEKDN